MESDKISKEKDRIAGDIFLLSIQMSMVAKKMKPFWPDKAKEMAEASKIADGWERGILEEIAGG